jgi:hypothetical protein
MVDETNELLIGLAGGAIGSVLAFLFAQGGRAASARSEIDFHSQQARIRNDQLVVWVDDRTQALEVEMRGFTNRKAEDGQLYSGSHGSGLAHLKEQALHEYRDERWRAEIDIAQIQSQESGWHSFWRFIRRKPRPRITVDDAVGPFLDRWREPVTRHQGDPIAVLDRTTRSSEDAQHELAALKLD